MKRDSIWQSGAQSILNNLPLLRSTKNNISPKVKHSSSQRLEFSPEKRSNQLFQAKKEKNEYCNRSVKNFLLRRKSRNAYFLSEYQNQLTFELPNLSEFLNKPGFLDLRMNIQNQIFFLDHYYSGTLITPRIFRAFQFLDLYFLHVDSEPKNCYIIALTCFFLASKYEDRSPVTLERLQQNHERVDTQLILQCEFDLLTATNYQMERFTILDTLQFYLYKTLGNSHSSFSMREINLIAENFLLLAQCSRAFLESDLKISLLCLILFSIQYFAHRSLKKMKKDSENEENDIILQSKNLYQKVVDFSRVGNQILAIKLKKLKSFIANFSG